MNHIYINISNTPNIVVNPGGNMGFYILGICHYIKNHYDISNKVIHGFSSGSINTIFLSMDQKYDDYFLKKLFSLNLNTTMKLNVLMDKTIQLMDEVN